jgi:hypothetical protein
MFAQQTFCSCFGHCKEASCAIFFSPFCFCRSSTGEWTFQAINYTSRIWSNFKKETPKTGFCGSVFIMHETGSGTNIFKKFGTGSSVRGSEYCILQNMWKRRYFFKLLNCKCSFHAKKSKNSYSKLNFWGFFNRYFSSQNYKTSVNFPFYKQTARSFGLTFCSLPP